MPKLWQSLIAFHSPQAFLQLAADLGSDHIMELLPYSCHEGLMINCLVPENKEGTGNHCSLNPLFVEKMNKSSFCPSSGMRGDGQ
jgi:hypothetical protein